MNVAKRIIALFLCVVFCAVFSVTAFAEKTTPKITLSNISAMPNDEISIDVVIENNPGIMGMAFSIAYEEDAFEYINYDSGWLTGMTVKNHPDKGYVIFVYVATANKTNNGKMLTAKFKIKEKAAPGPHKIVLGNNNYDKYYDSLHNSFSNSKQEYIVPTVSGGTVTVGETCINAGHKWGDWNITKPADCDETGLKNHTCTRDISLCIEEERYEEVEIPITHDFEADWTVDEAATPEKDGVMTRHCKKCEATTDKITFTYEDVTDSNTPTVPDTPSDPDTPLDPDTSTTPRPPINNNVGDKNPQSSVENLKDYQENIKPNLDPDDTENTDENSSHTDTSTDNQSTASDPNASTSSESEAASSDNKKVFSLLKTPLGIVFVTVGTAVGCSALALAATVLIIKFKKK